MGQRIKQSAHIPIGKNIRKIRKQKGWTQKELVQKLQLLGIDMARETLVKIERGIQHIHAYQLKAIRDVLDTTYDQLFEEETEEEETTTENE